MDMAFMLQLAVNNSHSYVIVLCYDKNMKLKLNYFVIVSTHKWCFFADLALQYK